MREIKFRGWDGKKIYNWDSVDHPYTKEITGTPYPKLFYLPMSFLLGDSNDWVWMQYTGLKDKNRKEIYEGDVVCWVTDVVVDSEGGFNRTEPEGQIGTVKYGSYSFYVDGEQGSEFYSYGEQMFLWSELEIIGNIYENPELCQALG